MLTRKLITPLASAGIALSLGLLSQTATATEEIVVNGAEVAARVETYEALLRSEMKEYVRSLNHSLKATLDKDLKEIDAPKLELAALETSTRG
jgi:hypothetical protein